MFSFFSKLSYHRFNAYRITHPSRETANVEIAHPCLVFLRGGSTFWGTLSLFRFHSLNCVVYRIFRMSCLLFGVNLAVPPQAETV